MQRIDWNQIYKQQSSKMIGIAYRYVKDRKQAEDLVQDAFIVSIQKTEHFKGTGAIEAWLRRIVVNECLMFLRKAKLPTETLNDNLQSNKTDEDRSGFNEDDDIWEDDPGKKKIIARADFSQDDLLETANMLPEHHRLVFNLYVIDNFSHKDIAAQLGISEGTSKSHLNRARKKLQDLLYQKATDMQKKKKKRIFIIAWFASIFGKVHSVDAMYKDAFSNFQLPPVSTPPGLIETLGSAPAAAVGVSSTVITTTIVGSIVAVGGIVGTVAVINNNSETTTDSVIETEYIEPAQEDVLEIEEFFEPAVIEEPEPQHSQNAVQAQPEVPEEPKEDTIPIVVKRVTVYDTIYED